MPVSVYSERVNVEHLLRVLRFDVEKVALALVLLEVMGHEPVDCGSHTLGTVGTHVNSARRELRKALGLA